MKLFMDRWVTEELTPCLPGKSWSLPTQRRTQWGFLNKRDFYIKSQRRTLKMKNQSSATNSFCLFSQIFFLVKNLGLNLLFIIS